MMWDEELLIFCEQNKDIRIERDENHQLFFLPPITAYISNKNSNLSGDLRLWNRKAKSGLAFDSSAGFFLPDTSMRSPDAAWKSHECRSALTDNQRKGFAYVTPDFVVELASLLDSIAQLKVNYPPQPADFLCAVLLADFSFPLVELCATAPHGADSFGVSKKNNQQQNEKDDLGLSRHRTCFTY